MEFGESLTLSVIKISRKYFRNTWVHRLPFTSWVYKQVFSMAVSEPEKEVSFRGKKFLVYTRDTSMVPSIINQDYESFELNVYEQLLRPGMTVLDVGANLGIYSVLGSSLVGPRGSIHSFEPVPENNRLLRHNLKLNDANNVKVVDSAIGDSGGEAQMYLAEDSIGTHTMGANSSEPITVKVDTLDNYVKSNELKVDFLKIDIEGYEGQALQGAKKLLKTPGLSILTEFAAKLLSQCGNDPKAIADLLLKSFKYCYLIDERKGNLSRINSADELAKIENSNLLLTNRVFKLK